MDGGDLAPLATLAREITTCLETSDHCRITAGRKLLEAQQRVQSGEAGSITWTAWVKANIKRSMRDVQKVMALARSDRPEDALEQERATRREGMALLRHDPQVEPTDGDGIALMSANQWPFDVCVVEEVPLPSALGNPSAAWQEIVDFLDTVVQGSMNEKILRLVTAREQLSEEQQLVLVQKLQSAAISVWDHATEMTKKSVTDQWSWIGKSPAIFFGKVGAAD